MIRIPDNKYELIFEHYPTGLIIVEPDTGLIISANKKVISFFGMDTVSLLKLRLQELFPINVKDIVDKKNIHVDGFFLSLHIVEPGFLIVEVKKELFTKKQLENQLLLFREVLEHNNEGVVITGTCGTIKWANRAFSTITGYKLEEVVGKNPRILKSGLHDISFYQVMWEQLLNNGEWTGEIYNRKKDGSIYPQWLSIYAIKDKQNETTHYTSILKDITKNKIIDNKITLLSQRDPLTGLFNRKYFIEQLDKELKNNTRVAVLFIDLDHFNHLNDSLGHEIGDKILVAVANQLLKIKSIYLLARYGGDEFVLLVNEFHGKNNFLEELTKVIIQVTNTVLAIEKETIYISSSIGLSIYPEDGITANGLISNAEIAMYRAKKMDNKFHFYSQEMRTELEEIFLIKNHLRTAIEKNELSLHYQPIVDLETGNLQSGEALIRWDNFFLGRVSPAKFIPIAEEANLIYSIGEWVVKQVCKDIVKWKTNGYKLVPIAINISVKQLEQENFVSIVKEIIEASNVDFRLIEFEITESVSSGNFLLITKTLKELSDLGISIAMDDFGTGYSSFNQLNHFQLDKLKIDRSFISEICLAGKRLELVRAMIAMSKSLDLKVVAEGIESDEQLFALKHEGCHFGQGYLFSRPIQEFEFSRLLNK